MTPANGDEAGPSSSQDDLAANMKKRNKPPYHPFTQQELPACKPILAPQTVIPVLLFVGIIFIPLGLACIAASNKVVEVVYQYETRCVPKYMLGNKVAYIQNSLINKACTRILKVPKDMKRPIYIYYQLDKFYQNHRRYMKSRNDMQLRNPKEVNNTQYCKPEATEHGSPVVPCGLIAWSLFNDTYSFARGNKPLIVNKRGISWRSEREVIFGNQVFPKNFQNGPLIGGGTLDPNVPVSMSGACYWNYMVRKCRFTKFLSLMSNFQYSEVVMHIFVGSCNYLYLHLPQLSEHEDLMVWMRTAALPTFRKLYGRIDVDLKADQQIMVTIQNNYNTYSFGGKKALVLSTAGVLGGKNSFLGRGYVVVGLACLLLALLLTLLCLVFPLKEEHLALRYPLSQPAR